MGHQSSFTKKITATFTASAGAGETVRAVTSIRKGELEVPFTIRVSSKSHGVKTEAKGLWHGISTWDLHHTISKD